MNFLMWQIYTYSMIKPNLCSLLFINIKKIMCNNHFDYFDHTEDTFGNECCHWYFRTHIMLQILDLFLPLQSAFTLFIKILLYRTGSNSNCKFTKIHPSSYIGFPVKFRRPSAPIGTQRKKYLSTRWVSL